MPQHPNDKRPTALKDQFEELRCRDAGKVPDIEELLDEQIRRRFGEMISRAIIDASTNDDNKQ
jgi:hypothetical protein